MPGDRFRHAVFPSVSSVGPQALALRAEGAVDDRSLPVVVLLTALPRSARLAGMNAADQRLLFDAFRVFERTLRV